MFCVASTALCLNGFSAQQKPLTRTFTAGTEEHYQVAVRIRAETHGVSTERVGEKTYVKPFSHEAHGQISWRAIRRVAGVEQNGGASLSEKLQQFEVDCGQAASAGADLQKSVQELCSRWQDLLEMKYEEETSGSMRRLPEAASQLAGPDSPFLSLWLRRALRPSVIFPTEPMRFGEPAQHRIGDSSEAGENPYGTETTEWSEGGGEPPAAILHVTQSLSWSGKPANQQEGGAGKISMQKATFYADSLNTVSLLDGSLLSASRSASYQTTKVLEAVPGLPEAPEFGSKLTITVSMQRLR